MTQYCRTVTSLRTWLDGREVTQTLLGEWKSSLIQRLRPSSVNAALAALNSFLKYMRAAEGWDLCKMTFVKVQRRLFCDESREISKEEYRRLVTVAAARGHARLGMLLETMCSLGIRVSEIGHITAEAVRAGKAYIHMKGKTRTILIPDILANKLMKYMKKRGIKTGRIFITRTGRGISRSQVWKELNRLSKEAGVDPRKVFPHNFRHLFARTHYEKYGDIVKLADILGHSSIETTRRYLITSGKEHARQLEELGLVLAE